MRTVVIPEIGAARAWRKAARVCLTDGIHPADVLWCGEGSDRDLFEGPGSAGGSASATVPRSFVDLAQTVCWHRDPERFARLYAFLWRLKDAPHLMADSGDRHLARLLAMEKAVLRCQDKMRAFVRFRELGEPDDPRRSFAAWFEPTHRTVEPTAPFFARRFADMDWRIVTPERTAVFCDGALSFGPGQPKPAMPDDASEDLWRTYFRNIFNPARLKVRAMQSQMPKKYWKNMPEAAAIPDLTATAPARARAMAAALPMAPPKRAERVRQQVRSRCAAWSGPAEALPAAIHGCTRCPLHLKATQAVPGEGPTNAPLMIVGEQPGDREDIAGRPFVGPAGQLFDRMAQTVGLNRSEAFVTNAVKHFKFAVRGKRRLHQRPNADEVSHCRWWLDAERAMVRPQVILALGATAAQALTGSGDDILHRRGTVERLPDGTPVLITLHPSSVLRLTDPAARAARLSAMQGDLARARSLAAPRQRHGTATTFG